MYTAALVFLGGGIGSLLRYTLTLLVSNTAPNFPYATLLANALSCILLGLYMGYELAQGTHPPTRHFLAIGICGGFSTFSTFTADTYKLYTHQQYPLAILNIVSNMLICLTCLIIGIILARKIT